MKGFDQSGQTVGVQFNGAADEELKIDVERYAKKAKIALHESRYQDAEKWLNWILDLVQ